MHVQRSRNQFTNDTAYIGTRFLLGLVREQGLVPTHVLKIIHTATGATHILLLFPDGRYMCDCCMATSLGVVCRHYLQAWLKIPGLPFHVSLIRARWYIDPHLDASQIEPVTLTKGVTNHNIRFSAGSLPLTSISNPLSSTQTVASGAPNAARNLTPAASTRTIPQRHVYSTLQADMRSLMNGIQTQDQLDDMRDRLERIR
ncbi:hypothetical protein B0H17DRAFT_964778 [Mycena rosella]|uniref:SWIM-type domain-containing protein n=1 Tax=Mycena rosella TaxID=1033263 RepID=A0AAD7BG80_MYCRO|nr:hypothetical protein B0H17DRAFT_964778 [Mycena rosella]